MDRRDFLLLGAGGAAVAMALPGCGPEPAAPASEPLTPAATAPRILDDAARAALDVLGEALVPGAAAAGFADYLEAQFAAAPARGLLMLRYLGVPPPWQDFYLPALRAAEAYAGVRFGKGISALSATEAAELVGDIAAGKPAQWDAPPAPFFYFVLRADALDVAWGTRAGFERLDIPYMAHIAPRTDW